MSDSAIGILGGIFDPVHYGHLAVAALAREHLDLQTVYFVPAGVPPHKSHSVRAPARHRLAMLRLALRDHRDFRIYRGEIEHQGPSYTIDTIGAFEHAHPGSDLDFIIGSDNLAEIPTWRRYKGILNRVTLCVAHRPGFPVKRPAQLRDARIRRVPSPEWGVSSTMIRAYLRSGHSCCGLLPKEVRDYVARHRLYSA